MSATRTAATICLVVLVAGGAGFLLHRLSNEGPQPSFADSINAAASRATGAPGHGPSDSASADSGSPAPGTGEAPDGGSPADADGSAARLAAASPEPPTHIPALTLPDIQGKPRALSEWKGRPLLINFWATWCEPCRREIPLLKQLRARHAKDGLEVIGIAIDFRDAVRGYAGTAGIDYPVLVAEEDATAPRAFGVGMGLPTTVFADREGRIVRRHVGELRAEEAGKQIALALGSR